MDKNTLIGVIKDFQERVFDGIVERSLDIPLDLPFSKAVSLIGPRRSGKTHYFYQTVNHLRKTIDPGRIFYVSLDDDRLYPVNLEDMDFILKTFQELYPDSAGEKNYFFFDEIQNVEKWELFIRRLLDTRKAGVYLSGSSAGLLSRDVASSLRGRTLTYEMFPFSFAEFLRANNNDFNPSDGLASARDAKLKNLLREYIAYGGFPEVALAAKGLKEKITEEYLETTLYRDIVERHKIRSLKAAKVFMKLLIGSFAREFSVNNIFNFVKSQKLKASKNTLYDFLDYFCDALVVFPLRKFSYSAKEREQSMPKIYLADNGYVVPYSLSPERDWTRLVENTVFMHLKRSGYKENRELFYYRTGNNYEVDFLITNREKVKQLIQVCFSLDEKKTREREIRALKEASKELSCRNLLIITWDEEGGEDNVRFVPMRKYLLQDLKKIDRP